MNEHLVFVYGTLKQTVSDRLEKLQHAHYMGEEVVGPGFVMRDLGPFPAVVHADPGGHVMGEVWSVDLVTLRILDIYEDFPKLYLREPVPTRWGDAWIYYMRCHEWVAGANLASSHNNVFCWDKVHEKDTL